MNPILVLRAHCKFVHICMLYLGFPSWIAHGKGSPTGPGEGSSRGPISHPAGLDARVTLAEIAEFATFALGC